MSAYLPSLIGGMLIGLSAIMLLILNGRLAGISGIVGSLVQARHVPTNGAFVAGLILGPVLYLAAFGAWPMVAIAASLPVIVVAGFLVGFGTRMGSGCTSGHGILGLARFSRRSMVATGTFMLTGVLAATLMRILG